jgi:glycosyltransferase involved in cell wall biosynthesis
MKRILVLSTSMSGGGGISAAGIKDLMDPDEFEFIFLTRDNRIGFSNRISILNQFRVQLSRLNSIWNRFITKKEYGFVSLRSIGFVSLDTIRKINPHKIHIHNWYNLISTESLKRILKEYDVIFTAHDTRILSGGCHVFLGCSNYKLDCKSCPAVRVEKKKVVSERQELFNILKNSKNLTIVSPSEWLRREIATSFKQHKNVSILSVPNPVNVIYHQRQKALPIDNFSTLLFVAAELRSPFKGLELLIKALNLLIQKNPSKKWHLTLIGNGSLPKHPTPLFEFKNVGIKSQLEIIDYFDQSDLLIIPSLFDNYPTIATEAQLFGIPVLGTRVGGIPEIIEDNFSGFLCSPDSNSLATRIESISINQLNEVSNNARRVAQERNDRDFLLSRYETLYS